MDMITFANDFDLIEIRLADYISEAGQWFAVPARGERLIPGAAASFISGLIHAHSLADRICFFDDYTSAFDLQDHKFSLPCDVGVDEYNLDLATLCTIISDDALWKRLVLAFLTSDMGRKFSVEFKMLKENRRELALLRINKSRSKEKHVVADQLITQDEEVARKRKQAASAKASKDEKKAATRRALELKKCAKVLAKEVGEA
jgi:hypothetical protein